MNEIRGKERDGNEETGEGQRRDELQMRAMAVAGWHSAIQSGLEQGRAWAWEKGRGGE